MNTELKETIRQAEGRYLTDGEAGKIRAFAQGMAERLEVADGLAVREEAVVAEVLAALPDADVEATTREVRSCLRAVAHGFVRDDLPWFDRSYVRWNVRLAGRMLPPGKARELFTAVRAGVDTSLDAADARPLRPFLDSCIAGAGGAG